MTARNEIHSAALAVCSPERIVRLAEIVAEMRARGTQYEESTIRTQVTSRLCVNAPRNFAVTYPDFEHIGPRGSGIYRLLF